MHGVVHRVKFYKVKYNHKCLFDLAIRKAMVPLLLQLQFNGSDGSLRSSKLQSGEKVDYFLRSFSVKCKCKGYMNITWRKS